MHVAQRGLPISQRLFLARQKRQALARILGCPEPRLFPFSSTHVFVPGTNMNAFIRMLATTSNGLQA